MLGIKQKTLEKNDSQVVWDYRDMKLITANLLETSSTR